MVKHSTISSPSSDYTITYGGDSDYMTDTGTEYTFNTDSMMNDDGTITLNGVTGFGDMSYVEDSWPMEHTVQDMIKEYPALRIQYEKFIEIYNLVKDDYRSGQKKNV